MANCSLPQIRCTLGLTAVTPVRLRGQGMGGQEGTMQVIRRGMLCQRDGRSKLLLFPVCVLQLKRGPARVGFVTD